MIMNKKLSYRKYKRRQRCTAVVLLLSVIFFIALGFAIGWNIKGAYTACQLPSGSVKEVGKTPSEADDADDADNKCTSQVSEEVASCLEGDVLCTTPCDDRQEPSTSNGLYIELTEEEKHELACLIYLEGRGESIECQTAIGSVVLNRYTTGCYSSLHEVIYAEGQFTPAHLIDSTEPTITQVQIVNDLCMNGPSVPEHVTYFRANKYHTWSSTEPYKQIDETYFSSNKKLLNELG